MAQQADISVLRYPDNVRVRRGMYLVSPDQCVFEMVDNAVDEYAAGRCKNIAVAIIGEEVIVVDDGSGIPIKPSTDPEYKGMPMAEVAYTTLHAGGKFGDNSKNSYTTNTSGMNGRLWC